MQYPDAMADIVLRPLLAQAPETSPPLPSWGRSLFLLPVALALLGILLATAAAKVGQANERLLAETAHAPLTSYMQPGRHFTQWDGVRYEEIIEQGYTCHQPDDPPDVRNSSIMMIANDKGEIFPQLKNVVWYPLYALLGSAVKKSTGLPTHTALTVVSQTCLALSALVIFALARRHFHNRLPAVLPDSAATHPSRRWDLSPADSGALWTVAFVVFAPAAVFLYANYTESLFLLLLALFLYCIQGRAWWRAALVAAVASSCRSQGVLFGPVLALTFLLRSNLPSWPRRLGMAGLLGMIAGLGLLAYMIYLHVAFGDALVFMKMQKHWHVGINASTLSYALNPVNALNNFSFYAFELRPVQWPRVVESASVLLPPILLMILGARFLSFELELIGWLLWGLPYVSNALAASEAPIHVHWMSMGRFMTAVLPLQIIAASVIVRFRWLAPFFLAFSVFLFTLLAYAYGGGNWVG